MDRRLIWLMLIGLVCITGSCRKRTAAAPPAPLPQPSAPAPPAPVISITADRTSIDEGDSITLAWKTENASAVQITEVGDVEPNGSVQVTPRSPTTYTATATGPGGSATDTVRITVMARVTATTPSEPTSPKITLDEDFRNNIEDVYFDYDRANLRPDQLPRLQSLVRWLRENPGSRIVIEGHCDDRGSEEYNLGLGDLRASSVRTYLADAGISRDRLNIVSYGEERPVCTDRNESCWSRNRHAHFVLENPQ